MVPSLTNLPPGCAFAPRCPLAIDRCRAEYPPLQDFGDRSFCGVLARGGNGGGAMTDAPPLLEVTDLVKHYRGARRHPAPPHRHRACGRWRQLLGRRRRDARAGRRIRLRQVDGRAQRAAAGRTDQRRDPLNGDGYHPSQQGRDAAAPALDADRVPGPVRLAQSAHDRRRHRRRAARRAWPRDRASEQAGARRRTVPRRSACAPTR